MQTLRKTPCCPELVDGKKCDYLDFVYRLSHHTDVILDNQRQRVTVEVGLHIRIERCTGPLQLGNVVYSTTLLPGEQVRLFTQDRRSRFSFDSETQLSYRHEQSAEEQFYLDSYEKFMSDLDSREEGGSSSTSSGSSSSSAGTSGLLGTIFNGPSVSMSGSFNGKTTADFLRELHVHAEASHNKSVQMTRESSAVQVGEVQTKTHAEGESESHVESSSRTFSNPNRCHAVTYLFYQIDKTQTVKVSVRAVNLRVVDPAGNTAVVNNPILGNRKLSVIPTAVLATSENATARIRELEALQKPNVATFQPRFAVLSAASAAPVSDAVRAQAIANVKSDLVASRIIEKDGRLSKELEAEFNFEFHTSIPTPGIVVKGCLDDCSTCEESRRLQIALELEHQKLQNQLLARQIELLDKSQEYRCCPKGEEETAGEPE